MYFIIRKEITVYPFITHMNPTQDKSKGSTRKKYNPSDIILFLLGIFLLLRTPWGNMNSFYTLLIVLYVFCIMLRISNIRKQYMRKAAQKAATEKAAGEKAEAERTAPASMTTADSTVPVAEIEAPVTETEASADRNENTPQA